MDERSNEKLALPIGNAIKSLYQLIVLVDEADSACHLVDCDDELENLGLDNAKTFSQLCAAVYKNIHPEDRQEFTLINDIDGIHAELSQRVSISKECRIRYSDFKYYWTQITICNAKIENSAEGREYLFLLQNIHEQKLKDKKDRTELISMLKALEEQYLQLFEENMTDQQTGCLNRKGLMYYEEKVLSDAKKAGRKLFVCVLDLNGLKYLNDTYGHSAGDEAIRAVSDAILAASPDGARIIRTGGDEFLVMAAIDSNSEEDKRFEVSLKKHLEEYNNAHDNPYSVNASYGIVMASVSAEESDIDDYVEEADKKMYEMKEGTDPFMR